MRQTAGVIRVVCVGRARGPLAEASAEYQERLERVCKFELHELREEGTPSLAPREAVYFIPEPAAGRAAPQTNDVFVDDRQRIYTVDRYAGFDIL